MRRMSRFGLFLAGAAWLLPSAPQAQSSFFRVDRRGPQLSQSDYDLLLASIDRLNQAAPPAIGKSESWSDPRTGVSGTSTLVAVKGSGDAACHVLTHHIMEAKRNQSHDYRLTWCPTGLGAWKIRG